MVHPLCRTRDITDDDSYRLISDLHHLSYFSYIEQCENDGEKSSSQRLDDIESAVNAHADLLDYLDRMPLLHL